LQSIGGLRSDGNILPQPVLSVSTFSFKDGDVVVIVEVQPSPFPPVRYKERTYIRVGPRKAIASEIEERILTERGLPMSVLSIYVLT
jgi:ATP-dependent DNA helicase RecG